MPDIGKYRGMVGDATFARWQVLTSPVAADAVPARGAFPVVLFSHGWASRVASSSIVLAELASHGYVVVGVDHPHLGIVATAAAAKATSASDRHFASPSEIERFHAADLAFVRGVLERLNSSDPVLRGAFGSRTLFAAGHSSGFAAAATFAAMHPGVRAVVSFDAGPPAHVRAHGLALPVLLVRADSPSHTGVLTRPPGMVRGTFYDSATVERLAQGLLDLYLPGTGHDAVLDATGVAGHPRVPVDRAHRLITSYVLAFLRWAEHGAPDVMVAAADTAWARLRLVHFPPLPR